MPNKMEHEGLDMLVKAMLSLSSEEECRNFLEDLMTKKEQQDLGQRLLVAKLLAKQTVYSKIVQETGASTATISRVKRSLDYGTGGYACVLSSLQEGTK